MNTEILEAVDEYYKLKYKYDKVKENEIKKIISDSDLSKRQKREKFFVLNQNASIAIE